MDQAVILSTARTPIGKAYRGSLNDTDAPTLASYAIKASIKNAGIEPSEVEDVIIGAAVQQGTQGYNIGRLSAAASGLPVVCSDVSGLDRYRDAEWLKLIPLGDDDACRTALQTLCGLPIEERQRLGSLARKEAENSMTWAHCTEALHEMLLEVKR